MESILSSLNPQKTSVQHKRIRDIAIVSRNISMETVWVRHARVSGKLFTSYGHIFIWGERRKQSYVFVHCDFVQPLNPTDWAQSNRIVLHATFRSRARFVSQNWNENMNKNDKILIKYWNYGYYFHLILFFWLENSAWAKFVKSLLFHKKSSSASSYVHGALLPLLSFNILHFARFPFLQTVVGVFGTSVLASARLVLFGILTDT